jgi:hypothetical protein
LPPQSEGFEQDVLHTKKNPTYKFIKNWHTQCYDTHCLNMLASMLNPLYIEKHGFNVGMTVSLYMKDHNIAISVDSRPSMLTYVVTGSNNHGTISFKLQKRVFCNAWNLSTIFQSITRESILTIVK